MPVVAGVDPGVKGGIAVIGSEIELYVLPPSLEVLCENLHVWLNECEVVGLEDIHAIYGVDKGTMFTMGRNLGRVEAALFCSGFSVKMVPPKIWQREVWEDGDVVLKPSKSGKTMVKDTKATSLNAAKRLFPGTDFLYGLNEKRSNRRTKPHDGLIDSLLIAEYINRKL